MRQINLNGKENPQYLSCDQVNFIVIDYDTLPSEFQAQFRRIINRNINTFANPKNFAIQQIRTNQFVVKVILILYPQLYLSIIKKKYTHLVRNY